MWTRVAWVAVILYWCLIAVGTHYPALRMPDLPGKDKTAHMVAYAGFALLLTLALWSNRTRDAGWIALAICAAWGAVDELTQPAFNRYAEMADFTADVTGASLMLLVLFAIRRLVGR